MNPEYWTSRATVRRFTLEEVPQELIDELLRKASHAPTTGNMQLYSVVVSRDREQLERLAPAHFNQPAAKGARVMLTFCADFNRFVKWCEASAAVPGYDNFQSFMTAVIDTVILTQQFVTLAEQSGLGCCYLGTTTYNAPQIAEALELPARVVPVATIALGWPEERPVASDRLSTDAFVHHERYDDPSLERVKRFYEYKESLPESVGFVAENNKQSLAQVFTDVRYTRQANEAFSTIYRDFIASQGFAFPGDDK